MKNISKAALFALTAVLALHLSMVPIASAQSAQPEGGEKAAKSGEAAPKVKVERSAGGRKVFRITTGFVIEGRIQKPNAFYVLQRSQINYDWATLKRDFTPRILESVNSGPF